MPASDSVAAFVVDEDDEEDEEGNTRAGAAGRLAAGPLRSKKVGRKEGVIIVRLGSRLPIAGLGGREISTPPSPFGLMYDGVPGKLFVVPPCLLCSAYNVVFDTRRWK